MISVSTIPQNNVNFTPRFDETECGLFICIDSCHVNLLLKVWKYQNILLKILSNYLYKPRHC